MSAILRRGSLRPETNKKNATSLLVTKCNKKNKKACGLSKGSNLYHRGGDI
jgi:hypothetical protein